MEAIRHLYHLTTRYGYTAVCSASLALALRDVWQQQTKTSPDRTFQLIRALYGLSSLFEIGLDRGLLPIRFATHSNIAFLCGGGLRAFEKGKEGEPVGMAAGTIDCLNSGLGLTCGSNPLSTLLTLLSPAAEWVNKYLFCDLQEYEKSAN